jgi:hypothetical protein
MKLVARVHKNLQPDIHRVAGITADGPKLVEPMSSPSLVEIVQESPNGPCLMYRYTRDREFCGDTWHANLEDAYSQANYEYGLLPKDFLQFHES